MWGATKATSQGNRGPKAVFAEACGCAQAQANASSSLSLRQSARWAQEFFKKGGDFFQLSDPPHSPELRARLQADLDHWLAEQSQVETAGVPRRVLSRPPLALPKRAEESAPLAQGEKVLVDKLGIATQVGSKGHAQVESEVSKCAVARRRAPRRKRKSLTSPGFHARNTTSRVAHEPKVHI